MNPSLSTLQKSENEIVIDFAIEDVKKAIMLIFQHFPSKYLLRKNDVNEIFNTYHFPVSKIANPAIIDMSLEQISENKTKIKISVTNAYGSISSNSILAGVSSDYLLILAKVLKGEKIDEIKPLVNNSGCMVVLFLLIASISIAFLTI